VCPVTGAKTGRGSKQNNGVCIISLCTVIKLPNNPSQSFLFSSVFFYGATNDYLYDVRKVSVSVTDVSCKTFVLH
ncbi:hypothetical protein NL529_28780, partial [Klebsiella pneumoniae]|nr:hypothetical protein [Klebsiella pneumoniae]